METEIWAASKLINISAYSNDQMTYGEFRKKLSPLYLRNSLPLLTSVFQIIVVLSATSLLANSTNILNLALILSISGLLGLIAHRQLLLVHEGAHFHLAKNRTFNDLLSNTFAGIFVATDTKTYRLIHNKHHQELGTSLDPENSYSEEFDLTWVLSALLGIRVLKTLFKRQKIENSPQQLLMLILSLVFHSTVIVFLTTISLKVAIIWTLGYFFFMPFFGSLRNVLEHKYEMKFIEDTTIARIVGSDLNFTTRMFTKSKFSKLFGVVGFDRHLIHHWDPSIPAVNLKHAHSFFLTTELKPMIEALPTTYSKAFLRLMRK